MGNVSRGDGHHNVSTRRANAMSVTEFAISALFFCARIKFLALRIRCCQRGSYSLWAVGIRTSPVLSPFPSIVPIPAQVREA